MSELNKRLSESEFPKVTVTSWTIHNDGPYTLPYEVEAFVEKENGVIFEVKMNIPPSAIRNSEGLSFEAFIRKELFL